MELNKPPNFDLALALCILLSMVVTTVVQRVRVLDLVLFNTGISFDEIAL